MKQRHLFIKVFRIVLFWVVLLLGIWYAQEVLQPKFLNDATSIVNGFYACEEELDVIFIGPSTTFCAVEPSVLREEYGVKSYVFASSAQTLDISYVYLQEVLRYQTPQVVVCDVSRIKIPETVSRDGEPAKRWGYTDLRFSWRKLVGLYYSCGGINDDFWTYVFPILRYKDRWSELQMTDYTYIFQDKTSATGGYMGSDKVAEEDITICDLTLNDGEERFEIHPDDLIALENIIDLCRKEDIQLLFFKTPVGDANWGKEYYNAIADLAETKGISYIDCGMYLDDIGMEKTDFRDTAHCNNSGANKVTMWLGEQMIEYLRGAI